ncbi:hypothetical protein [Roseomonas sp. BN140053]|uniref:hypothetical protein n=1 Tax=Roseomonas sp. BN140053 TaxID=3391898 RepID=UPI0039ED3011
MAWFALGALVLLVLALGLRAFAGASVSQVRTGLGWFVGLLVVAVAVLLLLGGRTGQVLWLALPLSPLAWRWWRGRRLAARFAAAPPAAGDAVETATLSMRLDPAAGTLSGTVRRGEQAGRDLSTLSLPELLALRHDCATADPESLPLLDAWLDRAHPGWGDASAAGGDGGGPGTMTRAEALAVLGLPGDADAEAVRAAYTRLMRAAHPDTGGSDWLAARLNQARDVLLHGS